MIWFATALGITLVIVILSPFVLGRGDELASAALETSTGRLESIQTAILDRYLSEETAHANGALSEREWKKRRMFLVNRYIDAARRLEILRHQEGQGGSR